MDELEVALVAGVAHLYRYLLLVLGREGGCDEGRLLLAEGRCVHYVLDLAHLQPYVGRLVFGLLGRAPQLPDCDGFRVLDLFF